MEKDEYYLCPHCGKEISKEELDALGLCIECTDRLQEELHGIVNETIS